MRQGRGQLLAQGFVMVNTNRFGTRAKLTCLLHGESLDLSLWRARSKRLWNEQGEAVEEFKDDHGDCAGMELSR